MSDKSQDWYHLAQQKMAIIALPPPSSSDGEDSKVKQEKVTISNLNGGGLTNAAIVFFPPDFKKTEKYTAIIVAHPSGGVKEQCASIYARKLARTKGFVTLVFDSSYNGASTGSPRHLENPQIRVEDISAVVDYLTTVEYVDKYCLLGICTAGGYVINATMNDKRIRAVGAVNCVNIGEMFRKGWDGTRGGIAKHLLEEGAEARTEEANDGAVLIMDWSPETRNSNDSKEQQDAYEYYRTLRGAHPDAPSKFTGRSLTQLATYDAFHLAKEFLTQPTMLIVGEEATTKWYSQELLDAVGDDVVSLFSIRDASHFDLYDKDKYVDEVVDKLAVFFKYN
ncbi:hypothetical protein CJU90_3267 [Yarrowia sp. C11]|nr:hypothetical protein CKK34_4714 [Yarrowia sp. E02]KAG5369747.1 hypothetical protein CJU90_3267 [Yarrowia sp. C11]